MSGFEINKMVGALLTAILIALGLSFLVELATDGEYAESEPAYIVGGAEEKDASVEVADEKLADEVAKAIEAVEDAAEVVEVAGEEAADVAVAVIGEVVEEVAEAAEAASGAVSSLIAAIAAADLAAGEKVFKKCKACHSVDEGGLHKVGPNLWGVVGAPMGRHADYKYSGALTKTGGTWDYASLDAFLTKPKDLMAGTKMVFPGVKNAADRAAVIAYLRSNAASPAPLTD